jgi:undecaprenyl-diphosphatase
MSGATAIFIICNKKWSWALLVGAVIMAISRVYLMAHYPTDVIAGILVGAISGVIAWLITNLIYKVLNKYILNK